MSPLDLNARALRCVDRLLADSTALGVTTAYSGPQGTCVDCGVHARGGLEAGRRLAEVCLAELGDVRLVESEWAVGTGTAVQVYTDQPVAACLASQYAGWELAEGDYFAMGSGPMRAAAAREALFDEIPHRETAEAVVGVLETSALPPATLVQNIAEKCGVEPTRVTLLVADTTSLAGTVQIVARSVETALHKLHELGFELGRIRSGFGAAPLPPPAPDKVQAIGRSNDAILYGGQVTLWVDGDDASLERLGPQVPSGSAADHGRPFAEIFAAYDHDFYRIDRGLFSPAQIRFVNLESGRTHDFGQLRRDVLSASFTG